jgi:hypothetical protein
MEDTEKSLELRPSVLWFAQRMEEKLRKTDFKGGWATCTDAYLVGRMREELVELEEAAEVPCMACGRWHNDSKKTVEDIIDECVDVANFAMMEADNKNRKIQKAKR